LDKNMERGAGRRVPGSTEHWPGECANAQGTAAACDISFGADAAKRPDTVDAAAFNTVAAAGVTATANDSTD
jgi:hypothetical protein